MIECKRNDLNSSSPFSKYSNPIQIIQTLVQAWVRHGLDTTEEIKVKTGTNLPTKFKMTE